MANESFGKTDMSRTKRVLLTTYHIWYMSWAAPYKTWELALTLWRIRLSKSKPPSRPPAPITAPKIKHIAVEGLRAPSTLTSKQTQELAASVMAHIEPRKLGK